jgi:hypothetical protein
MALPFPAAAQRLCDRPFGPMSERCNRGHLLFRNQKHRSAFNRRQESRHVFEYLKKRHLALFAFAFGSAGCLMAWTINLSIERLLATDWDQKGSAPLALRVPSRLQERTLCLESRLEISPTLVTTRDPASAIEPCPAAELEPRPHIGLR